MPGELAELLDKQAIVQNTRVFVGSYDFGLVREDARWRISEFRFNLKYTDGNRQLEASS